MNNTTASNDTGKTLRTLLISALLVSIAAGALFMPAMAESTTDYCIVNPDGISHQGCVFPPIGPVIWPPPFWPWPLPIPVPPLF